MLIPARWIIHFITSTCSASTKARSTRWVRLVHECVQRKSVESDTFTECADAPNSRKCECAKLISLYSSWNHSTKSSCLDDKRNQAYTCDAFALMCVNLPPTWRTRFDECKNPRICVNLHEFPHVPIQDNARIITPWRITNTQSRILTNYASCMHPVVPAKEEKSVILT